jgi:hypothetical protein
MPAILGDVVRQHEIVAHRRVNHRHVRGRKRILVVRGLVGLMVERADTFEIRITVKEQPVTFCAKPPLRLIFCCILCEVVRQYQFILQECHNVFAGECVVVCVTFVVEWADGTGAFRREARPK